MHRKRTQARECALQILYQHEMNPEPLADVLKDFWVRQEESFSDEVRAFADANLTHDDAREIHALTTFARLEDDVAPVAALPTVAVTVGPSLVLLAGQDLGWVSWLSAVAGVAARRVAPAGAGGRAVRRCAPIPKARASAPA